MSLLSNSDFTAYGVLTLTSNDGSTIVIEDGETDAHTGLDKLGLMAQSEDASTSVDGLGVSTVVDEVREPPRCVVELSVLTLDEAVTKPSVSLSSFVCTTLELS